MEKPETMRQIDKMIQKRQEKKLEQDAQNDSIVLECLKRFGRFQGRVMELRKHLCQPLREAQIKDSIKRLVLAELIKVTGEKNASKGSTYEVYK